MRICECFCAFILVTGVVAAQNPSQTVAREAAYVSAKDIQRSVAKKPPSGLQDSILRVLPVGDQYNVGVSIVRRARVNGKTPTDALLHHDVTEVYEVISGSGTLVTGGELADPKEIDDPAILAEIGPTAQGRSIRSGKSQHLGVGDVVIIPAGVPHGFSEISLQGVSYVVVRIGPHHVLKIH
jgi:mannose-6-phosphate isomerase-like protein (cupin superfamily)